MGYSSAAGESVRSAVEPHGDVGSGRLNWLRAGVLGANDGIVSVASIVAGVAGATVSAAAILIAGIAGLFAGACSMAVGEYVSVSSQRDAERALLAQERRELAEDPDGELTELTDIYIGKGLPRALARQVATTLTARDPLAAHAEVELGVDPDALSSPWQAAGPSFLAFTVGALFPLCAAGATPAAVRLPVTIAVVALTLVVAGVLSARLGQAPTGRAVARNLVGGLLAMAVTYGIGVAIGHSIT